MRNNKIKVSLCVLMILISGWAMAQNTTLTGKVATAVSSEAIPAVSVTIKGSTAGTFTDDKGNFKISTQLQLPIILIFSSIGYTTKEVTVSNTDVLKVELEPTSSLGEAVVVSASRVAERILESPVSVERIGTAAIRNAAAPNYYEAVANLKGADLTASSIYFRTVSTRGFNGSGNLRLNQLVDGMDNQAPALNFAVGSVIGLTELDLESVELLQGASSALYGSGGTNGTLIMNSKDPFKYQGFSFQIKQGINHVGKKADRSAAPVYDWSFRWAKKVTDKLAFKLSGQYLKAQDWQANDQTNVLRTNVLTKVVPGTRASDPNYDGVNVYGDEANISMQYLGTLVAAQVPSAVMTNLYDPLMPGVTNQASYDAAIATIRGAAPPGQEDALAGAFPIYMGLKRGYYGTQVVSRTGYQEEDMVDYNSYNFKLSGSLNYKITDNTEASLMGYWGQGTAIYTGADRYVLKNLRMGQFKAEVKSANWFLRAYTTLENSGDSYIATGSAVRILEKWKSHTNWFQQYAAAYSTAKAIGAPDAVAHTQARTFAEQGRFEAGSKEYEDAKNSVIDTPISEKGGKFADNSRLFHYEGQYNFTDKITWVDLLAGASYRVYSLNSRGTIFADTTGKINIWEYGGYLQASKKLLNEVLKLTASVRYDKNQNFKGRLTPRVTAMVKVANDNNLRLSYQTAYRFPSTQNQWINLVTPASRLIGGLQDFNTFFGFDANPLYTVESVSAYRNSFAAGAPNPGLLKRQDFTVIKPESVNSYELGYRGLIQKNFLIDAYIYLSAYKDFIGGVAAARGISGNPAQAPLELLNQGATENFSFPYNVSNKVTAIGWGLSADYKFIKEYTLTVNVSGDQLNKLDPGVISFFNTPQTRFNIGVGNNKLFDQFGFNLLYRWQANVDWEGTFGFGKIPAYGTVDAQVSYRIKGTKSLVKLGASNLFNNYYRTSFGNPNVGGLYYVSFGYNVF